MAKKNSLKLVRQDGTPIAAQTREEKLALLSALTLSSPDAQAARTMQDYTGSMPVADHSTLLALLSREADLAEAGSLARAKRMLSTQAEMLNAVATDFLQRAARSELLPQFETYVSLALRAQANCRKNLESLAEIVQGRPVFARNANVAQNQQINVGTVGTTRTATDDPSNELMALEHDRSNKLEIAGRPQVEAVAALDRAKNSSRKGTQLAERSKARASDSRSNRGAPRVSPLARRNGAKAIRGNKKKRG